MINKEQIREWAESYHFNCDIIDLKTLTGIAEQVISDLAPKWVSVDDNNKTTIGELVLCYGFTGEDEDNPDHKDYDLGEFTKDGFKFFALCNGHVTHWIPLPQPPK